jgi:D-xylose transport system substrate-binding protein
MSRALRACLVAALAVGSLGSCRVEPDTTVVALLLGSTNSTRWSEFDEPAFRQRVEALCPDCEYLTRNAQNDPDAQAGQLGQVLRAGADVVVLNAVTTESGEELVKQAGSVPVVAYDRQIPGADYFVSYDADAVGSQMAEAVVRQLDGEGNALVLNGAQTDQNGVAIKRAVHRVLDRSRIEVLAELDPDSWSEDEAAAWVSRQLARRPAQSIDAIVAANDTQAAGVAAALDEAGVAESAWPVITGQDADLAALRRIVMGRQTLTVFKSFPREAEQAADLAVTLATGRTVEGGEDVEGVPSFIFDPIVVTLDNLTDTVVRDGVYAAATICQGPVRARCVELGII